MQVRVVDHLLQGLHRSADDAARLQNAEDLVAGASLGPGFHDGIHLVDVRSPAGHVGELDPFPQLGLAHGFNEPAPVPFANANHGHMAILGPIDVVGCQARPRMPIAGARPLLAAEVVGAQRRGQRRKDRILHGDVDDGALAGSLAPVERTDDGGVEMHPAEEVAQRRAGFERRRILKSSNAHDAGHGLNGDVHAQVVPVRTDGAVAGAGGIDQLRIVLTQGRCADAVAVHRAGREVLQNHIHLPRQAL